VRDFELLGELSDIEIIAIGSRIDNLPRLRRLYGKGRWRKMKGIAHIRLRSGRVHLAELHWYEAMASAGKKSSARGTSTRAPRSRTQAPRFAVCIRNTGYEASLERNKIYVILPDEVAEREGDIRVVDESGEDYLFAADRFVAVDVPAAVKASLLKTA
jgi:hypothetical protein